MNTPAAPSPVVIGVIDDGIAFAHERFRKIVNAQFETRVEYWWLQDGPYQGLSSSVDFGRELKKADIDALLNACTRADSVDEDLLYQKARLIDFRQYGHKSAAWRAGHGTHVMDLACGLEPAATQPEIPIICVQLPIRVTAQTSGASLHFYVVHAITYILDRARTISMQRGSQQLPVVINLSYGRLAGPHDGTLDLEWAIDQIISQSAKRGVSLRVVLPAGNSYLSRCHARVSFQRKDQVAPLLWRVMPDDRTPSFLEIWLPARTDDSSENRVEITVTSPTGQSRTITETSGKVRWKTGAQVYGQALYSISPLSSRGMFLVAIAPTAYLNPAIALAPAGVWTIKLKNKGIAKLDSIQAWIQRDDSLYGFPPRGRQSYFDNECYVRYDHAGRENEVDDPACLVRRESTINGIATGRFPIVVGGHLRNEMVAARYSSAGAAQPPGPPPNSPDASAVSEDSRVHRGILAAGTRSGSVVAIGGTSVAAPQVARWSALALAAGKPGDRGAVQAQATQNEMAPPAGTPALQPERSGKGRLRLPSTSRLAR
jgi:hypothetical protein